MTLDGWENACAAGGGVPTMAQIRNFLLWSDFKPAAGCWKRAVGEPTICEPPPGTARPERDMVRQIALAAGLSWPEVIRDIIGCPPAPMPTVTRGLAIVAERYPVARLLLERVAAEYQLGFADGKASAAQPVDAYDDKPTTFLVAVTYDFAIEADSAETARRAADRAAHHALPRFAKKLGKYVAGETAININVELEEDG